MEFDQYAERPMADITLHLDDELYSKASRLADLDRMTVEDVVQGALRRHLDYIDVVEDFSKMAPFSLKDYELQRDPDESDEDYAFRRSLFR
jgi:hypothetical protein